jgi:Protein of unknown function (DUF4235)
MADKRGDMGGRVISGVAAMAAAFATRKLISVVWTKATGKEPPSHPEDPNVRLGEALGWAVGTGVAVATVRLLVTRETARRFRPAAGDGDSD